MSKTRKNVTVANRYLEQLAKDVETLPPPNRLRIAADLLEQKKAKLALSIINKVSAELGAALLLQKAGKL